MAFIYFLHSECRCVKFSMPRDKDTPICGAAKIICYTEARNKLFAQQILESLTIKPGDERVKGCNCLPACTSISYDAEIFQHPLEYIRSSKFFNSPQDEFHG